MFNNNIIISDDSRMPGMYRMFRLCTEQFFIFRKSRYTLQFTLSLPILMLEMYSVYGMKAIITCYLLTIFNPTKEFNSIVILTLYIQSDIFSRLTKDNVIICRNIWYVNILPNCKREEQCFKGADNNVKHSDISFFCHVNRVDFFLDSCCNRNWSQHF